jgi:3-hydroxyisobutyrate dehydrogenase
MAVGFIGLGTMGGRMAANLRAAGHDLVVHDLERDLAAGLLAGGARWAASPAEVAAESEVVLLSLPGPKEVVAVTTGSDGVADGAAAGTAVFDLTTNSPTVVRRLHEELAGRSVQFLDAPVSGGPQGAASRRLAIWVGGDLGTFERHLPVLRAFSDAPRHVGDIGAGSIAKLVHNMAGYAVQTAMAEVFTLGVKAGMDPVDLWSAVRTGAIGRRRTFDGVVDQYLPGRYEPAAFALRLAHKDVSLATELGRELGVPMRIANLTLAEMTEAINRGWADRDSRVAMLLQNERAGVEVAADPDRIAAVVEQQRSR